MQGAIFEALAFGVRATCWIFASIFWGYVAVLQWLVARGRGEHFPFPVFRFLVALGLTMGLIWFFSLTNPGRPSISIPTGGGGRQPQPVEPVPTRPVPTATPVPLLPAHFFLAVQDQPVEVGERFEVEVRLRPEGVEVTDVGFRFTFPVYLGIHNIDPHAVFGESQTVKRREVGSGYIGLYLTCHNPCPNPIDQEVSLATITFVKPSAETGNVAAFDFAREWQFVNGVNGVPITAERAQVNFIGRSTPLAQAATPPPPDTPQPTSNTAPGGAFQPAGGGGRLAVGGRALVRTEGDNLNCRSGSVVEADNIVAKLQLDTEVLLKEGPVEQGGYIWWQVEAPATPPCWVVGDWLAPVLAAAALAAQPCATVDGDLFIPAWREALGCPVGPQQILGFGAEQAMQGGHLFWREDTNAFYVVYDRDKQSEADLMNGSWSAPPQRWNGTDVCLVEQAPPDGTPPMVRGFSWWWCQYGGGPDGPLGWPLDREQGQPNIFYVQPYERGLVWRGSDPKTYALLSGGRFSAYRP